jgi:hypothetical protein
VSTIAEYSAQQQQVAYANAQAQQQYQAQLAAYQQSELSYNQQIKLNSEAANRAYMAEQQKLEFERRKATMEAQELMMSSSKAQGDIYASGRTGQSIGVMANDATREYSRDLATLGMSLGYAYQDYYSNTEGIFNSAQSQNNLAASNRMFEPTTPLMAPGPNALGLIGGLGGAALGGYTSFSSLRAPRAQEPPKTQR